MMTNKEALEALEAGEKIRKNEWCQGNYIKMVGGIIKNQDGNHNVFQIDSEKKIWEIYEEWKPATWVEAMAALEERGKIRQKGWDKNKWLQFNDAGVVRTQQDEIYWLRYHPDWEISV